ncbi:MAG: glutamate racemase [Clostridia bacterium]|nr:glutamate racemase [Clostridia bacterium]
MKDLIGFFDSGLGGISVLHEARRIMPNENYLFFGDNINTPYGTKSLEEIRALSERGIQRLLDRDVKAIVIACNTVTSAYAQILRASHPELPIIGMEPALKPAHYARHGGKVIVLATAATLRLEKFRRLMDKYGDEAIPVVGEGLVELVEAGLSHSAEADARIEALLSPYRSMQVDAVVLGCTHYPYLRHQIQAVFPDAELFDGRSGTVQRLKSQLEVYGLRSDDSPGSIEYQTSGGSDAIVRMKQLMDWLD